ncbi:SU10 major capsid protein [Roseomonas chloroacetimidivorans]|uniref:SU10 major capsid protein n=1 Tax=Roseomonas chloroacetimidivorans TaxID=1766656 RepID=UPI003C7300DB
MPTFNSTQIVGKKEDVSDVINMVSPTATPFLSSIKNGKVSNTLFQWQEDSLAAAAPNAQVEGADATAETSSPTVLRTNVTQILSKTIQVSETADAVDVYGRKKESARLLVNKGKELKRDQEFAYLSGQTMVQGNGSSTASKTASIQAQIDSSVTTTLGTAGPITQVKFLEVHQKAWTAGGDPSRVLCKPADKVVIASWATQTNQTRVLNDKNTTLTGAVDIYVTPFGSLAIEASRHLRTSDCLIYDPDMIESAWLRPWSTQTLAKTGDSNKTMIVGEVGLKNGSQFAHGLLSNLT